MLDKEILKKIKEIGFCDIVAGIPSYNSEETIGFVVEQIKKGFAEFFPNKKCAIVIADNSGENSKAYKLIQKISRSTSLEASGKNNNMTSVIPIFGNKPGKGGAIFDLMETAKLLKTKVLCLYDSDLKSIQPFWIRNMAGPILSDQFDFVTPNYIRDKFDGTITNSIVYPLTTVLYGLDIRQPIGGEFAMSKRLIDHYLKQKIKEEDIALFGIDIWLTTTALLKYRRMAQANLGVKIHDASVKDPENPERSVGKMFKEVVGILFHLSEKYFDVWKKIDEIYQAPFYGPEVYADPEKVNLNLNILHKTFQRLSAEQMDFWQEKFELNTFEKIARLIKTDKEKFVFDQSLWAEIVCCHLLLYHQTNVFDRDRVIASLVAFYFGKSASLSRELDGFSNEEAEGYIKNQIQIFAEKKKELIENWDEDRTVTGLHLRKKLKKIVATHGSV